MMYTFGKESLELQERLRHFMNEHIYPNEALHARQIEKAEDRFAPIPLMDELKGKALDAGLWNLFVPAEHKQYLSLIHI